MCSKLHPPHNKQKPPQKQVQKRRQEPQPLMTGLRFIVAVSRQCMVEDPVANQRRFNEKKGSPVASFYRLAKMPNGFGLVWAMEAIKEEAVAMSQWVVRSSGFALRVMFNGASKALPPWAPIARRSDYSQHLASTPKKKKGKLGGSTTLATLFVGVSWRKETIESIELECSTWWYLRPWRPLWFILGIYQ